MATSFPSQLDVFSNPSGSDAQSSAPVLHSTQHANANDAIEALQAKVGIDNSEDPASIDYILAHKVDQEAGKGLSSNDYTDAERTKLAGIAESANAYTHPANHAPSIITQDANNRFVTDDEKSAWSGKADLVGGKVPSAQLPSYVDDVIEASTFASLPTAGESGKIYVLDTPYTAGGITSSQFRWSGSAYAPIIASPGTTDAVTEGSTNLYFTVARVRAVVLTGLSLVTNAAISATDTVLSALGKLQKQITDLAAANTGDETAETIKAKLGISTLSGSNTGDQTLEGLGGVPAVSPSMSGLLTHSGDIALTGSGKRITGDFSNATPANRLMFQSSAVNGNTVVGAIPNGTSTTTAFRANNSTDPDNCSFTQLTCNSTGSYITAGKTGAGSYKPLALNVGGTDVMTISTTGDVAITQNKNLGSALFSITNTDSTAGSSASIYLFQGTAVLRVLASYGNGYIGTVTAGSLNLSTNSIDKLSIDVAGNVLAISPTGGLGYGTGAGGTVTQTTSRTTTTPSINKPNGDITLFTAAGSATDATFTVPNNLVGIYDDIRITTRGGTNKYLAQVTNIVANTSFDVTFRTTGGTASDTPIFHFSIGKGSNA